MYKSLYENIILIVSLGYIVEVKIVLKYPLDSIVHIYIYISTCTMHSTKTKENVYFE